MNELYQIIWDLQVRLQRLDLAVGEAIRHAEEKSGETELRKQFESSLADLEQRKLDECHDGGEDEGARFRATLKAISEPLHTKYRMEREALETEYFAKLKPLTDLLAQKRLRIYERRGRAILKFHQQAARAILEIKECG